MIVDDFQSNGGSRNGGGGHWGTSLVISGTLYLLIAGATFDAGIIWDGSGDWASYFSIGSAFGLDDSIGVEVKNIHNNNRTPFRIGQYEGFGISDKVGIWFVEFIYGSDVDLEDPWGFAYHGHTYQDYGFGVSYGIPASYTRQSSYT